MFNFKSITVKLFFLFLFVGLIPLVLIGFLSVRSSEQGIREEIFQGLVRYTESKEGQIFAYINFVETKSRYLAEEKYLKEKMTVVKKGGEIDSLDMNNFLKSKKEFDESLVGISILDLSGRVIFSSNEEEVGKDESKHLHFMEAIEKGKYASIKSGLMNHEHFGFESSFIVSCPITNDEGERVAILDVIFSLDNITDILNGNFQLQKGALTGVLGMEGLDNYVVNKEKTMFIHPTKIGQDSGHHEKMIVDNLPVRECLENNKEIVDTYKTYTGKEVLGTSMCIVDKGWIIVSEVSVDKAFLAVREIYYQLVLMIVISFLLVIGISLLLTDKVAKYLNKFLSVAKSVSKGNLDAQIDINTKDEIGFVANNFNKMINNLKKSRIQIEKEIMERTKDLENINKYMVGREIKMIELKERLKNLDKKINKNKETKIDWKERFRNTERMEKSIIIKLKNTYLPTIKISKINATDKKKALSLIRKLIKDSAKHEKYLKELINKDDQ